ncbi:blast:Acylphosphatase-2 [Drosophila guanche]|uniref:acylphosphatase n=1 Tax=Drosophila guanche TaxID=7266 RepID=A0A3B0JN58_DROGU|nr:blast:Acylphosphatase-2 [Drosophila guanche]
MGRTFLVASSRSSGRFRASTFGSTLQHTNNKAKQLGLVGWCMNTDEGSVKGVMEGSLDNITEMKSWLQHTGSPRSVIQKAVFSSNEPLASSNFKTFSIRR